MWLIICMHQLLQLDLNRPVDQIWCSRYEEEMPLQLNEIGSGC